MSLHFGNIKLGILGGGQLGRMLIQKAADFNIECHVLDPDPDAPCASITPHFTTGNFADYNTVLEWGAGLDAITIEIEHVNTNALQRLANAGIRVCPEPGALAIIQDKGYQKEFFTENEIPTAPYVLLNDADEIANYTDRLPAFQKSRRQGYDGNGVRSIRTEADINGALRGPCVLEEAAQEMTEISVLVARAAGRVVAYDPVEMIVHPDRALLHFLSSPARISPEKAEEARQLAIRCIEALNMTGILAVEMFLLADGTLWVNEMAPRPHNSGHQTIEAAATSQYEQLLRCVTGMPPGSTRPYTPSGMLNLLGAAGHNGPTVYVGIEEAMAMPGVHIHLYGKKETRPLRKMGHVTITGDSYEEIAGKANILDNLIRVEAMPEAE